MSSEYFSFPNESLIGRMQQAVEEEVQTLDAMYWDCHDPSEHATLKARSELFHELAEAVLMMARYENPDAYINLEDRVEQFIKNTCTHPDTGELLYDDESVTHLTHGAEEGIDRLLLLLAPPEDNHGDVRFIRWRRDLMERKINTTRYCDGSADVSLSTALPGVEIEFYYDPNNDIPQRTIYFRSDE